MPSVCSIPKWAAAFYDFDEYERLIEAANVDPPAYLVVLLGGGAGLRRGEMLALEWHDIDLSKRQLCVARSEWKHQRWPWLGPLVIVVGCIDLM